ncbi:hypothetical protein CBR_g23093 [Chara braunii]|uniref:Cation efflux protein transmembrane domain-containing protein n=1 Tax=Chara braunii TaxID=69332 RepID=A0A388L3Q5_CHABU|nr:hypothetical protein CBR_g23093 [Chara braunii]|eukprot:GBG76878.1 hypothetical protein CBR_g23093 [Chara braunii]
MLGMAGAGIESQPWTLLSVIRRGGDARRLFILILLNATYSSAELLIGLGTGQIGLVSDSFHLTFGCCILLLSLFAMAQSRQEPDVTFTYGYERLEVLAAFTNTLFLLFLAFSLCVEALHAFIEDESEHKHYLIASAVANLLVNLLGVLFFRGHSRISLVYRSAQDMNRHSIFLHVLSDSIRSAGVILASWLLAMGVENAETIVLGLVAGIILMITFPLFCASGNILLQSRPPRVQAGALAKALREVTSFDGVVDCFEHHFWSLVPGYAVGTLGLHVKDDADEQRVLQHTHTVFAYLGVNDLTVQIEKNR